ncbi:MAG: Rne/Rng family ribonuclease [Pseudomonadota bacterium]
MTKKMLIDAAHPEEIRVAVIDQRKVEDFDFESASRKPLRGNIYLARVTRVEPSLQAAFVEYGGNRHGFLAFNEIHPDYYQVPVSDRQALQEAEAEEAALAAELELMQRGDDEDDDDRRDGLDLDDDDFDNVDDSDVDADSDADTASDSDDAVDQVDADTIDDADEDEAAEIDASATADAESDEADTEDAESGSFEEEDPLEEIDDEVESAASGEDDDEEDEEELPEEEEENDAANADNPDADDASENDGDAQTTAVAADDRDEQPALDPGDAEQPFVDLAHDDAETTASHDEESADASYASDENDDEDAIADPANDDEDDVDDEDSDDKGREDAPVDAKTAAAREAAKARAALYERYKDAKRKRAKLLRNYKIQEVIKRRQILLVQVVKEERGNKGAALTTYMSLAGRYCVLMPNTARGGGISRKIPSAADRRRLRRVVDDLDVPQGMGLIIRTAGAKRTKTEVKRDYDYLIRLWENIRALTLKSIAPCLVYEEASLIKRAIRDLYDKDISQVLVEGETGYREAKDFMKMLMPSHAKNVQPYKETAPIFLKYGVENQLDGMYQPSVRLKSGGYIVIHQTEALVAIDVNSGRATRERNIEQTALKTNIEAAQEAARQFRLRDLAGLVVIDFIDMEEPKNNRTVERKFKDAIKADRARIQVGRISNFGLLELSRQRRRSGIVDGTTNACPTCAGAGVIRSHEMAALRILRAIEGDAVSGKVGRIVARTSLDVSLHILNHNRAWLKRIEDDNGVVIEIAADTSKAGDLYELEKSGAPQERKERATFVTADQNEPASVDDDADDADDEKQSAKDRDSEQEGGKKRRRRRRRRKDSDRPATADETSSASEEEDATSDDANEEKSADASTTGEDEEKPKKRRRRGRRGGRRNRKDRDDENAAASADDDGAPQSDEGAETANGDEAAAVDAGTVNGETMNGEAGPPSNDAPDTSEATIAETAAPVAAEEPAAAEDATPPVNGASDVAPDSASQTDEEAPQEDTEATQKPTKPKSARKGWWQRAIGS